MSLQIICDGCGNAFDIDSAEIVINGDRANGLDGGGLPNGRFDWCLRCAQIAFKAVREELKNRIERKVNE
jgi:hypothetical protein